jgi:hypothetical protein
VEPGDGSLVLNILPPSAFTAKIRTVGMMNEHRKDRSNLNNLFPIASDPNVISKTLTVLMILDEYKLSLHLAHPPVQGA